MAAPHHHSHLPGASLAVPGSLKASTTSARSFEFGDRFESACFAPAPDYYVNERSSGEGANVRIGIGDFRNVGS